MYFASPKTDGKTFAQRRSEIVQQVMECVLAAGESPENALKAEKLFRGETPALVLRYPEIHVAHVNAIVEEMGAGVDPIQGHLVVSPRGGTPYTIKLTPASDEVEQHQFLVAIKRDGDQEQNSEAASPPFWSYQLVVLATEGERPLVLALDCNSDGTNASMDWSQRLYFSPQRVGANNQLIPAVNRLATLKGLTNLPGLLLKVAVIAGFPVKETRQNRASREQRFANAGRSRQAPSLVGASAYTPAGTSDEIPANPFADTGD